MIIRIALAGLTGGAVLFLASAVQNALLPAADPRSLPQQDTVLPALGTAITEPGLYFFPGTSLSSSLTAAERAAAMTDYERRAAAGPSGVIAYVPHGADVRFGRRLVVQFALSVTAALGAAIILALGAGGTPYATRVLLVALVGACGFVYLETQYWNWYGFPGAYTAARVAGGVFAWTLAALPMAAIAVRTG
jgi:hypothetical protein